MVNRGKNEYILPRGLKILNGSETENSFINVLIALAEEDRVTGLLKEGSNEGSNQQSKSAPKNYQVRGHIR